MSTTLNEQDRLNILRAYVASKLEAMQEEKAKSTTMPNMVTKAELFAAIEKDKIDVLNQLFKAKKLRVHKTIHAPQNDYVEYLNRDENGETEI